MAAYWRMLWISCRDHKNKYGISERALYLRFNGHFPGGPGLAGTRNLSILDFVEAKDDGGGSNNWSS